MTSALTPPRGSVAAAGPSGAAPRPTSGPASGPTTPAQGTSSQSKLDNGKAKDKGKGKGKGKGKTAGDTRLNVPPIVVTESKDSSGSSPRPSSSRPKTPGSSRPSSSQSRPNSANLEADASPSSPYPSDSLSPLPGLAAPVTITTTRLSEMEQSRLQYTLAGKRSRKLMRRLKSDSDSEHEGWTHEDVVNAQKADAAACRAFAGRHIELIADGRAVHTEAELGNATVPPRSYVWEVMYENQRGVTMWGKSVYSSNTLLPSDPTPFTLPRALPASEVADDGPGGSGTPMGAPPRSKAKGRARKYRESINTEYTLESYQTPSPAWAWLTPWMVNMRTQTDEQGWEYNLWFHKRSWRAHPGHFNWWGWVRRREWVRLRALVPEVIEKSNEETREAARDFWGPRHRHHGESGSGVASRNESARNSRFEGSTPNVSTQVLADSPDSPDTPEDPVVAAIRQRRSSEIAREVRPETTMGWGMGDVAEEAAVRHIHQGKGSGDGDNPERDHPHDHEHEDHEQAYDSDDSPASDATSITTTGSCSTAAGFISLPALLRTRTPVPDMVRALALVPLDREKLDTLVSWIEGADEGDIARLQRLLQDPADLENLSRAFVFPASRNNMFRELVARGIVSSKVCNDCVGEETDNCTA